MRVRITTKPLSGSFDGLQFLAVGETYDVSTSLGYYLLCERWAVRVADDSPAVLLNDAGHIPTKRRRAAAARDEDQPFATAEPRRHSS